MTLPSAARIGKLALAAGVIVGCHGDAPQSPVRFELAPPATFVGPTGEHSNRAFDIVSADMDVDGDDDLLINWHHLGAMELFENGGGRFELVNRADRDRSGLYDNRGCASLFAGLDEMQRRIERVGRPGLYVWHDLDRRGSWRFTWRPDAGRSDRALLDLETSLEIAEIEGLDDTDILQRSPTKLRLALGSTPNQTIRLKTEQVTIGLELSLQTEAGEPLTIFVGRDLAARPGGVVELWKPDPHGIAWVDVEGDARPEIFITRGALIGQLRPPRRAKRDRYLLPADGSLYELAPEAVIPRDRERGRRVEWVDVDNDGSADLSVASESSSNRLLMRPPDSEVFGDRAGEFGLDLFGGAVQTWGDYDGDGRQDVYILAESTIEIRINRGDAPFETIDGESVGLRLPPSFRPAETQFDFASLRLADFDSDGDLDLWLLSSGRERTNHLFRRDASHFTDISERVGLDRLQGNIFATLCDFDNDGFEDGLSSGWLQGENRHGLEPGSGHALLWHNQEGREFSFERLPSSVVPRPIHAATCLDADGDGRIDLAAVGIERELLLNLSSPGRRFVDLVPRDGKRGAIGAVVRVSYSNGRIATRRYGSARSSAFSQSLAPLHFGVPEGVEIEGLSIRWPGQATDSLYPPPELDRTTIVQRRPLSPGASSQPPR